MGHCYGRSLDPSLDSSNVNNDAIRHVKIVNIKIKSFAYE